MTNNKAIIFTVLMGDLAEIPGTPFAYWAPQSFRELFSKYPPLDRDVAKQKDRTKIANVKKGLSSADDLRFTRYWWEVSYAEIGTSLADTFTGKKWVSFSKGGEPFFQDSWSVILWENNGQDIKSFPKSVIRNEDYYFTGGLSWAYIVKSDRINIWLRPAGSIFLGNGPTVFLPNEHSSKCLLALLNSKLAAELHILLNPLQHSREVGEIARLPILIDALDEKYLSVRAEESIDLKKEWSAGDESAISFVGPWILMVWSSYNHLGSGHGLEFTPITYHPLSSGYKISELFCFSHHNNAIPTNYHTNLFSLRGLADVCVEWQKLIQDQLLRIQNEIDKKAFHLYGIAQEDQSWLEAEIQQIIEKAEDVTEESDLDWAEDENDIKKIEELLPTGEHLRRLVHSMAHQVMKVDDNGIIPLDDLYRMDGNQELGLISRVKRALSDAFGEENLVTCLNDLQDALGMSLDQWLATEFFNYHVGLYRLRPIIWQVTSQPRGQAAFSCFVYWHKLDADTLRKIQQIYLRPMIDAAKREAERIAGQVLSGRQANLPSRQQREIERQSQQAEARLRELQGFEARLQALSRPQQLNATSRSDWVREKVNEIVASGYRPERDYGVRVNIEPFKQAGILPRAADRVKG
jgi:hypothetical protein